MVHFRYTNQTFTHETSQTKFPRMSETKSYIQKIWELFLQPIDSHSYVKINSLGIEEFPHAIVVKLYSQYESSGDVFVFLDQQFTKKKLMR